MKVCACVYVCVGVWERKREFVCVCVWLSSGIGSNRPLGSAISIRMDSKMFVVMECKEKKKKNISCENECECVSLKETDGEIGSQLGERE